MVAADRKFVLSRFSYTSDATVLAWHSIRRRLHVESQYRRQYGNSLHHVPDAAARAGFHEPAQGQSRVRIGSPPSSDVQLDLRATVVQRRFKLGDEEHRRQLALGRHL